MKKLTLVEYGCTGTGYGFTRTGILAFVNEVTGEKYTEIEFTKRI